MSSARETALWAPGGRDEFLDTTAYGLDAGEFYDLEEDPGEQHNLWDDPEYGPVKMQMLKRLCDRMAWTVDPLPLRVAGW